MTPQSTEQFDMFFTLIFFYSDEFRLVFKVVTLLVPPVLLVTNVIKILKKLVDA